MVLLLALSWQQFTKQADCLTVRGKQSALGQRPRHIGPVGTVALSTVNPLLSTYLIDIMGWLFIARTSYLRIRRRRQQQLLLLALPRRPSA
jgi:hypothetical protein